MAIARFVENSLSCSWMQPVDESRDESRNEILTMRPSVDRTASRTPSRKALGRCPNSQDRKRAAHAGRSKSCFASDQTKLQIKLGSKTITVSQNLNEPKLNQNDKREFDSLTGGLTLVDG